MHALLRRLRLLAPAFALVAAACVDGPAPTDPSDGRTPELAFQRGPGGQPDVVPEVLELPGTVFGGLDDATGQLVFGVEHPAALRGVETALARRGIPASSYRIRLTEPIRFASSLRDSHRPTTSGLQINFGLYVCTLGFSVDFGGVASFVTNSHCTDQQGTTEGTLYYQPSSSVDANPIAVEVDDPAYGKNGCSKGKKCRYSDAARAVYADGIGSLADIPLTNAVNSGSLAIAGYLDINAQANTATTFSGTVEKVGRTTGWTSGTVTDACVTVNVSGSNIQLLCQTIVENPAAVIVGGGDSGSPVFQRSGGGATLVGILWGGSSSGHLLVFSPFSAVQGELGAMTATFSGTLTGGGGGGGGGGDGGSDCPPNSNSPRCR